jgi:hypothetical protein
MQLTIRMKTTRPASILRKGKNLRKQIFAAEQFAGDFRALNELNHARQRGSQRRRQVCTTKAGPEQCRRDTKSTKVS